MTELQFIKDVDWTGVPVAQVCYELAAAAYPEGAPWRLATFAADLALPQSCYQLLVREQQPIGFISQTTVLDETEITNVAVLPAFQRHGYARLMLQRTFAQLMPTTKCFLEVRRSNTPAQKLYEQCGFEQISTRKNYYQHPSEDALIMRKIIK